MNKTLSLFLIFSCFLVPVSVHSTNQPIVNAPAVSQSPIEAEEKTPLVDATTEIKKTLAEKEPVNLTAKFTIEELTAFREQFLQAEKALANNNIEKFSLIADELKDYPLYPYLQYQWLKKDLQQETQVEQFLEQNKTSRYARLLNRKWLYYLAEHNQWQRYLQYYTATKDVRLQCYKQQAEYQTGNHDAALNGAVELWLADTSQPEECDPLFARLKDSHYFNQDLFWKRFDAALSNNQVKLAKYIIKLLSSKDKLIAKSWIKLHNNPEKNLPKFLKAEPTPHSALMFSHAISRLINKNIYLATTLWDNNKHRYKIPAERIDTIETKVALKLGYRKAPDAFDRLGNLQDAKYKAKALRVRTALAKQNWPQVITAIQALSEGEKKTEKWQYWLARAYSETNNQEQAEKLYSTLSTKRSFYGYMSADKVDSIYHLTDKPVQVSAQDIDNILYRNDFSIAYEFKMLNRERQAKLQWWHAIKQLNKNKNEIKAAAKLAQQWQWDEIAIYTIAKIRHWDDIALRFPLSYSEEIHKNAKKQELNPALLFGLIRRESAFFHKARSPVGARGLMQIMPNTGREIAKDLKQKWRGKKSLYNAKRNIQYGSYYYKKLVKQFKGNYALALAAYNAGPHRVKRWLPDESLPADIWIELIPFHETREYVTKVLGYAMIYQMRNQSNTLYMADLTGENVHPYNLKLVDRSY